MFALKKKITVWGRMKKPSRLICGIIVALCLVGSVCAIIFYKNNCGTWKYYVPKNLDALLALSNEELEKVDIAVINLLCAEGLPSSEAIDIEYCLKTLDEWSEHVLEMEKKYKPAFY